MGSVLELIVSPQFITTLEAVIANTDLLPVIQAQMIRPGDEAAIARWHGKRFNGVTYTVEVDGGGIFVQVLPTKLAGVLPLDAIVLRKIVYGSVQYVESKNEYLAQVTHVPNAPVEDVWGGWNSYYPTFAEALAFVTHQVHMYAPFEDDEWIEKFRQNVEPLDHLFPTWEEHDLSDRFGLEGQAEAVKYLLKKHAE